MNNNTREMWSIPCAQDNIGQFLFNTRPYVFTEEQILVLRSDLTTEVQWPTPEVLRSDLTTEVQWPTPEVLRSDGSNKQPDLTTKEQRQEEAKQWVRDILIPAQKEKRAKLAKVINISEYNRARPFSEAPETARLCGAGRAQNSCLAMALEDSRGVITFNFVNKKLENEIRVLKHTKLFAQYPIQFYKGRQIGFNYTRYKVTPGYNEASLVHGDSEKACNDNKELQEWILLFWDEDTFYK